MKSALMKGKIRGVTFKYRSTSSFPNGITYEKLDKNYLSELKKQIDAEKPKALTFLDIRRLLGDFGRHELHTLVSDAVAHAGHWRQILRSIEKYSDKKTGTNFLEELDTPEADISLEREILLEVQHIFRLWHHKLKILELIAYGQNTYRLEKNSKKGPPQTGPIHCS